MPRRIDFSQNVPIYDRRHDAFVPAELAEAIAKRLSSDAIVVDIGAGTGRVATVLAQTGLGVAALDPSVAMLQALRHKSHVPVLLCVAAEGEHLPLRDGTAEAVVAARLLYLVQDWRSLLREAKRVVRRGGFVFHEWGNGEANESWVRIRERARALFEAAGSPNPFHTGARSEAEVNSYLEEIGFRHVESICLGSGRSMTLASFLAMIESGEVSYAWNVPEQVRERCLPELRQWCAENLDLQQPVSIPARVCWNAYELVG